jgi:chromate reductase
MTVKVLALVGSIVTPCGVQRLTAVASEGARLAGAEVREIQLLGLDLPLFSFDREAADGMPPAVLELKAAIEASDGLLVGAPELNTSITGVLKNAIDWAARPIDAEGPRNASFAGKVAAMVSGSKWDHAGIRGLAELRGILAGVGCLVIPEQISVPHAPPRFAADGSLPDDELRARLHALGASLVQAIEARRG